MVSVETIGSIFIKTFKLTINVVVLILYCIGDEGIFLGVSGTWNLNEEKSPSPEIVASGIFVGFLIYTTVHTLAYFFGTTKHKRELTDTLMNMVGTAMWVTIGGVALHYWCGYMSDQDFLYVNAERQTGIAMGALCVIEGALYLLDTVLACIHYSKAEDVEYTGVGQ
ncbi:protein snakeskin [Anastrepha obliqua]|uniref:protein snakeskin-like n=1 Tax=Anastrepha ludens TaxID=28586 RepID=UPI0023AEC3A6|nr:protein snakeskin-like [Anastrepha ludens]XP_054733959.1 protein snakeskin [Anastrepha obliqua]